MKKKIVKIILTLILIVVGVTINKIFQPIINNAIAVSQMDISTYSYTNYKLYQTLINYDWIIYLVIIGLIYKKEIKEICLNLKGDK